MRAKAAHSPDNLGYAGCWCPVSGRKAWLLAMLGLPNPDDYGRYWWEPVTPADADFMAHGRRMLHVLADRARWQAVLTEARRSSARLANPEGGDHMPDVRLDVSDGEPLFGPAPH